MPDARTAAVRDAAQFLEFACQKLLEADACSPAGDNRARKLLAHVQTAGEVARGLALAVEKEERAKHGCSDCRFGLISGNQEPCWSCSADPWAKWEPRKAVGT